MSWGGGGGWGEGQGLYMDLHSGIMCHCSDPTKSWQTYKVDSNNLLPTYDFGKLSELI